MSTPPVVVLAHCPPFRLGASEVRPATRELIGPCGAEIVEPRVMQVLVALARANGEILSRDDLIEACWEGRIVSENAIDRVISRLRRLAETVAGGGFRIETITKVGYRLLSGAAPAGPAAVPPGEASGRTAARAPVDRRTLLSGAAAVAVGGAGIWLGVRVSQPDVPPEAVEHYDRGVEALRRGWAENTANAVSAFRQAVAIAPNYADAWGMLALAYQQSLAFAPPETTGAVRERRRSAARRALDLDPGNANALAAEAVAVPVYRNWSTSEAALRRALDRDGTQVEARSVLSSVLADVGRTRDALATLQAVAEAIDALPYHQTWLGWLLFCTNRLEEADRVVDRAIGMWPRQVGVWFSRLWLYAFTGRAAQALAMLADAGNRPIGILDRDFELVALSMRAMSSGRPADIDAAARANMAAAPAGEGYCKNALRICAYLRKLDEAFAVAEALFLQRGFRIAAVTFTPQQGGYSPRDRLRTENLFSPPCRAMRNDPRFRVLLSEIGLTDYWRRTGTRPDLFARS